MNTPIFDFVNQYIESHSHRLHMPGHKGINVLGCEAFDITEISGADSLYEASGIIKESETNAGRLFGCNTFYSAEGSSLCIRAMLHLALMYAKEKGFSKTILAARNAHKTFLTGAMLLDLDVKWLYAHEESSYLTCNISPKELEDAILDCEIKPMAVYITSPDYLGNRADIKELARICRKHHVLLLVDNAHGAYLKFLPESEHPMDLGADMCCDSAHKTLPVLTGGAYLHISNSHTNDLSAYAKDAMALFGSTSPSYLILQSLDLANRYLSESFAKDLKLTAERISALKETLSNNGYSLCGNEHLKLTIKTKDYGYTGYELAEILQRKNIYCEFADPDYAVFMFTPIGGNDSIDALEKVLLDIPEKEPVTTTPPTLIQGEVVMSPAAAMMCAKETVFVADSCGRILASPSVSCPPAVPVVVCGERISPQAVKLFEYYGITTCCVTKE